MYMLTWKDVQDVSVKWKIKFYIYLSISRSYKKKKSVFMCCLCACKRKANDVKYIYQNWEKGWDRKERELQLKKHTHLDNYFDLVLTYQALFSFQKPFSNLQINPSAQ